MTIQEMMAAALDDNQSVICFRSATAWRRRYIPKSNLKKRRFPGKKRKTRLWVIASHWTVPPPTLFHPRVFSLASNSEIGDLTVQMNDLSLSRGSPVSSFIFSSTPFLDIKKNLGSHGGEHLCMFIESTRFLTGIVEMHPTRKEMVMNHRLHYTKATWMCTVLVYILYYGARYCIKHQWYFPLAIHSTSALHILLLSKAGCLRKEARRPLIYSFLIHRILLSRYSAFHLLFSS